MDDSGFTALERTFFPRTLKSHSQDFMSPTRLICYITLYCQPHEQQVAQFRKYAVLKDCYSSTSRSMCLEPEIMGEVIINNNNHIQRRNSRFFTISSLRHELSRTRTLKWSGRNCVQITCNTLSACHVQHVLRAMWYKGMVQLLSLTEFKSH